MTREELPTSCDFIAACTANPFTYLPEVVLHLFGSTLQSQAELEASKGRRKDYVLTCIRAPFAPPEVGAAMRAKPARRVVGAELQTCKHRNVLTARRPAL